MTSRFQRRSWLIPVAAVAIATLVWCDPASGRLFRLFQARNFCPRRCYHVSDTISCSRPQLAETSQAPQRSKSVRSPSQPLEILETFLDHLARGEHATAYSLVAPSSKQSSDPIAYRSKLDFDSFQRELPDSEGLGKFKGYKIGKSRWESPDCFRIWVTFGGWDNDEIQIVRENGKWYVADPIHIIR